jgi:hypothetical protein
MGCGNGLLSIDGQLLTFVKSWNDNSIDYGVVVVFNQPHMTYKKDSMSKISKL